MKNKLFLMGIPAIALVFGMTVAGCDNVQTVAFERAEAVPGVVVKYEANGFTVFWAASKNAEFYELFFQDEPDKNAGWVGIDGTYNVKTDGRTDHQFLFSVPASGSLGGVKFVESGVLRSSGYRGRFGVAANDNDVNHARSDIVWSEYITIPQ